MEPRDDQRFPFELHVLVCVGARCNSAGVGETIRQELKSLNKERGNKGRIRVCSTSCLDLCDHGPNMVSWPSGETFVGLTPVSARDAYTQLAAKENL